MRVGVEEMEGWGLEERGVGIVKVYCFILF